MKLSWNAAHGPQAVTPGAHAYRVVHVPSREELHGVIYADDEAGEVWRFEEDADGQPKTMHGYPVIEKLVLGRGKIRLEPA